MRRLSGTLDICLLVWLLATTLLVVTGAWAKPTTPEQARTVVLNWLGLDALPLNAPLGRQIKEVQTFNYEGAPAYYVVHLDPAGMVFLPADDLVEPIIAFLPDGVYDPSPDNPLGALVSRDIPGRVLQARAVEAKGPELLAPETPQAAAQRKWAWLAQPATAKEALEFGLPTISDVRVAPLVQSKWDQSLVNGNACYNYYTPPYAAGSASNYVCGCVATAMAQLMRFWTYPTNPVVSTFTIYVSQVPQSATIRGGNGSGGNYDWNSMVLDPATSGVNLSQRQAIGSLPYDAGVSVGMWYDTAAAGGSGAETTDAATAFVNTFRYSNAKSAYSSRSTSIPDSNRNNMVNPNLDAGFPTLLGIKKSGDGGHAIVCDGYGLNSSTMYHHLNMGWSGSDNAWYNLPTVDASWITFDIQYKIVYNVYKTGSGEIISGRVKDSGGSPLSGVTVSAGGSYSTTTDANGIYALAKVPSNTTFTVTASKTGYTSSSQSVSTGTSANGTPDNPSVITGNKWGIDFTLSGVPTITLNQALDNNRLSFSTSGSANWYGESTTWYYGGSAAQSGAITANQYSQLVTTITGPGTLSFYWKVSSQAGYDFLDLSLDATNTNRISGEVDWTKITKTIPAGIHTITWKYSKDGSVNSGSDCGWVDQVVYTRKGGLGAILPILLQ